MKSKGLSFIAQLIIRQVLLESGLSSLKLEHSFFILFDFIVYLGVIVFHTKEWAAQKGELGIIKKKKKKKYKLVTRCVMILSISFHCFLF